MRHIKAIFIVLIALTLTTLSSCRKDTPEKWSSEYLIPLIKSDLSIQNLVADSLVDYDSDSSLIFVFRSNLYELDLADQFIDLPDTGIGSTFRLDSMRLPQISVSDTVSLGFLAKRMCDAGNIAGCLIPALHGTSNTIPAIPPYSAPPEIFDASAFFTNATLSRGFLNIYIDNEFPIPIENVQYEIRNQISGTLLITDNIPLIAPHSRGFKQHNLAGLTLEGQLSFTLVNLESSGSGGMSVPIDTSDFVAVTLWINKLRASNATAVFPEQELISITDEITTDLGDRKFTHIEAKEGEVVVHISSSVQEGMTLNYVLEGAYDSYGNPLELSTFVPAAPAGGNSTKSATVDISGFSINLTGINNDKFNTYTQTVSAVIDSSGISRTITSNDSLVISYSLQNVKPKYVKGYAGQDTINIGPESVATNIFNVLKSGTLDIDDINMSINLENWIGLDGQIKINQLSAKKGGTTVPLVASSVIGSPIIINGASEFPHTPASTSVTLNTSNSNADALVEILPDAFEYDFEAQLNPGGNDMTYQDFAFFEKGLRVNLDMEMPMSLIASNLALCDTVDFSVGNSLEEIENIQDGIFTLIAYNGYPLDANLLVVLYDDNFNPIDTLINNFDIVEGEVDNTCRVFQTIRSSTKIPVDKTRMDNIKAATKAIVLADFSTSVPTASASYPTCNGSHLKIFSDYQLEMKLTARFNYESSFDF